MEERRWRPGGALPFARSGRGGRGGVVPADGMEGWRWRPDGGRGGRGGPAAADPQGDSGALPSARSGGRGGSGDGGGDVDFDVGGFGSGGLFGSEHLVS
uniref:Uncharacterized protein n=1 Tax=Oryza barthii TaxID=65489 RepID=A0A0D3FUQ5_9ORYZ